MSNPLPFDLGRMIPGFDFFQGLTGSRSSGAEAAAGLNRWIAPTVDIDELERRISELKTVQFWLEQSLLGMKATIQALEVQKMTLAALRSMNLSMTDVARAFAMPASGSGRGKSSAGWPFSGSEAKTSAGSGTGSDSAGAPAASAKSSESARGTAEQSVLDPMQWWGALTQQFQQIARETLKEAAQAAAPGDGVAQRGAAASAEGKAPAPKRTVAASHPKAKKPPRPSKAGK